MVFRNVYQKEIEHFVPDIKAEIRRLIGLISKIQKTDMEKMNFKDGSELLKV
jgi:hypothetical protein